MLAIAFPGNQQLTEQIANLTLQKCDETLYYLAPVGAQSGEVHRKVHGVPVEGVYRDKDDATVFVWLFADEHNGLAEIEVWKPDGTPVLTYFAVADLSVRMMESGRYSDTRSDGAV